MPKTFKIPFETVTTGVCRLDDDLEFKRDMRWSHATWVRKLDEAISDHLATYPRDGRPLRPRESAFVKGVYFPTGLPVVRYNSITYKPDADTEVTIHDPREPMRKRQMTVTYKGEYAGTVMGMAQDIHTRAYAYWMKNRYGQELSMVGMDVWVTYADALDLLREGVTV